MKNSFLLLFVLGLFMYACTDEPIGQQPSENVPPGPISNVKVENTPGGAILTYTLPTDEDLLYVKAVFTLKDGVMSESRASMYTDTLKIAGFGDTLPREVTLIAVDRSRNESVPVKATINPLVPSVITIATTMSLVADFGGVHAFWTNPTRAEVSVVILKEDNNKEFVPIQTFYSTMAAGDGAQRGMDTIPAKFGIYIQDRWLNRSEVKYFTLTPIFETKFDRLKFKAVFLPSDMPSAWGWVETNLWDGKVGDQGFHTANGSGIWPQWFTMDLGVTGKVSRLIEFQRQGTWIYMHGNIRKFEVYGSATLDPSGSWDSWTLLMSCTSIKPSGLPVGQISAEDKAWAGAGEEFLNLPTNPAVRYIRLKILQTWSDGDFFHISELQFFGDNR